LNEFRKDKFKNGVPFTNDNEALFSHEFLETLDKDPLKLVGSHNNFNISFNIKLFLVRHNFISLLAQDFIEENK